MTARNPVRLVSAEPLRVDGALLGRPLAGPARRGVALALDAVLVAVLSSASGGWLALALLLLAWQVGRSMVLEGVRPGLGIAVAAVLALGAVVAAWNAAFGDDEPRPSVRTTVDVVPAGPASAASAVSAAPAVSAGSAASAAIATDAADRVAVLESELARLRAAQAEAPALHERLERLADELGLSFGWAIVYFTLLPAFWSGQTVGKRLLRLRIVALSGEPITPLRALKRYGGYAAGLATGGLGFLQVLWDPNRQGLQDKAAHTVVLDEREPARAASGPG